VPRLHNNRRALELETTEKQEQGIAKRLRILSNPEPFGFARSHQLGDVNGGVQRCVGGGGAGEDGVVAGREDEAVLAGIEDGEVERVELDGDSFRLAGGESNALPADEALEVVFAG
jgi:hypothetical protein